MKPIGRVIDANANRASEAARTLEDISRFTLDDSGSAAAFKQIRQRIEQILSEAGWPRARRAADRATESDVGTELSAADAHTRRSTADIAAAAGSRLTEALRVIEESLKLSDPSAAAAIERLRYDAYSAEQAVLTGVDRRVAQWPLCVLVSAELCEGRDWLEVTEQAILGGAACIQLREKSLDDSELVQRARRLVSLAMKHGAAVIINDRPDVAVLAEADGVHLGQNDMALRDARRVIGDGLTIGVSCATLDHARAAVDAGADYLGLGPMFASGTKPKPALSGPELLTAVLREPRLAGVPHLAISGIDQHRAGELASIGCRGVAVSSAVCGAADPSAAARSIVEAIETSGTTTDPVDEESARAEHL